MKVKLTAWIEGEYIDSDVVLRGKTLEDLFKQVSLKNGTTFFELLSKEDAAVSQKYLVKINSNRLPNQMYAIPLKSDDHVVVVHTFRFAAGG